MCRFTETVRARSMERFEDFQQTHNKIYSNLLRTSIKQQAFQTTVTKWLLV